MRYRTPESLWKTINRSAVQQGDHLIWTGTTSQGEPKIATHVNDKGQSIARGAARVIWELTAGPIPEKHWLRRTTVCDEALCVNPSHYALHDTAAPKPALIRKPRLTFAERIARRTQAGEGGCLIWTGSRDSDGYPKLIESTDDGKRRQVPVHRLNWELANGPIPEGQELARRTDCPNRRCIEPAHLRLIPRGSAGQESRAEPDRFRCGHAHAETGRTNASGELECHPCTLASNRERCRRWRARHPDKVREYNKNHRPTRDRLAA